jgi:bacillithiol system protein YtxJ
VRLVSSSKGSEDSQSFLGNSRTISPFQSVVNGKNRLNSAILYNASGGRSTKEVIELMGNKFLRIDDRAALDNLITDSKQKPVIVFKHSNACSISSRAYREMEKVQDQVNILEVQSAREVSRELANLTGVRHETPQVIVLRDGKAVWNASHFDVQAGAVAKAVETNS